MKKVTYSKAARIRLGQIADYQQQAYFCSGYEAAVLGQPADNDIRKEASYGYEELCFYNEGFQLGADERKA